MRILITNGTVVNVFTDTTNVADVLIENDRITGVGNYQDVEADVEYDATGKWICPGFVDGHIHIESTMLIPYEFAKACLLHGTTGVIADPHEIANVCGVKGIKYMLQASEKLPLLCYFMLPSCVPATQFDESYGDILAEDLFPLYHHGRVLGLGEVMNYPGVIAGDSAVLSKVKNALSLDRKVDGHAPLLTGRDLDTYISKGIRSEHECTSAKEAMERIEKGQWVMIREGSAARNLNSLLPLFDEPYCRRSILATDDKHPADLVNAGHIDEIIRRAVSAGKNVLAAIRMATIQAAQCFSLRDVGAVAPGYYANLLILDDLDSVKVTDVFSKGKQVVKNGKLVSFAKPEIAQELRDHVIHTMHVDPLTETDFHIEEKGKNCRVIELVPGELLTKEAIRKIDWKKNNGVDLNEDILKLAVIERHHNSGHIGLSFITGMGLKKGAIASTVSHDSHNLIVCGANDFDMALASNCVIEMGGGYAVASAGKIIAKMPLPIAGLMTDATASLAAKQNEKIREAVFALGVNPGIEPLMNMAFVSLPAIPSIKLTPGGLVDVDKQQRISLYVH